MDPKYLAEQLNAKSSETGLEFKAAKHSVYAEISNGVFLDRHKADNLQKLYEQYKEDLFDKIFPGSVVKEAYGQTLPPAARVYSTRAGATYLPRLTMTSDDTRLFDVRAFERGAPVLKLALEGKFDEAKAKMSEIEKAYEKKKQKYYIYPDRLTTTNSEGYAITDASGTTVFPQNDYCGLGQGCAGFNSHPLTSGPHKGKLLVVLQDATLSDYDPKVLAALEDAQRHPAKAKQQSNLSMDKTLDHEVAVCEVELKSIKNGGHDAAHEQALAEAKMTGTIQITGNSATNWPKSKTPAGNTPT